MSISKPVRPPLTEEYLTRNGAPFITRPAEGIVAIVSGDGYETVDMTEAQFFELYEEMRLWKDAS